MIFSSHFVFETGLPDKNLQMCIFHINVGYCCPLGQKFTSAPVTGERYYKSKYLYNFKNISGIL